ncbi:putative hydroxyacylglutathione hydrolase [Teladorsagia circumcincta]|uniref:hydroxyacylglutathione hydrolase n=1 Tax=Teladorsagia circumcincta TaxID=45464 RepID=A0A2G9TAV9_TELCI|nr:putative hydroxyacylglutathione hydrolase [Teladorsagia circumcincta]
MAEFRKIWQADEAEIYGGDERIDHLNNRVDHEEKFTVGQMEVTALKTPCHTKGHICYYVTHPDSDSRIVLTGDTLFIAGCGKFFEGTAAEMHRNLNEVLAKLPDDTLVYPGHEYTYSNLKFAQHIEPGNENVRRKLEWASRCRERDEPTVPSTIAEEKEINPFMRTSSPEIQKKVGATDLIEVMARVRQAKNSFRG